MLCLFPRQKQVRQIQPTHRHNPIHVPCIFQVKLAFRGRSKKSSPLQELIFLNMDPYIGLF